MLFLYQVVKKKINAALGLASFILAKVPIHGRDACGTILMMSETPQPL